MEVVSALPLVKNLSMVMTVVNCPGICLEALDKIMKISDLCNWEELNPRHDLVGTAKFCPQCSVKQNN